MGRFAPSPTGPLHLGSLTTAVASYLEARSRGGRWLLRIEDIDPPREVAGADTLIMHQLEQHGLNWDGSVRYQSRRLDRYREIADQLSAQRSAYRCSCTRARLKKLPSASYDGHCQRHPPAAAAAAALRLRVDQNSHCEFDDLYLGHQRQNVAEQCGDFVIWRRDGLVSYQLAVVIDDFEQGVNLVVRGADLLDNSGRQILLQRRLNYPTPRYGHVPLVVDEHGNKLSKQNRAPCLAAGSESQSLLFALRQLGQQPPAELAGEHPATLLDWAQLNWRPPIGLAHHH